jgi:hypothetical protein
MNVTDYVAENKITAEYVVASPSRQREKDWGRDSRHWIVTLTSPYGRIRVPYSAGSGIKENPTADAVMGCLQMDCQCYRDYEDNPKGFVREFGGDSHTYNACKGIWEKMADFLGGPDERDFFIEEVEGL